MTVRPRAAAIVPLSLMILVGCGPIGGMGSDPGVAAGGSHAGGASPVGGAAGAAGAAAGGLAGSGGSSGAPAESNVGAITVEGISTWRGNASAAYSIIHDDACDYTLDSLFEVADPELTSRGLRAGFGAIVERCQERSGVWAKVEALVSHGHEILCHSFTHPDFVDDKPDLTIEIDHATNVLAANVPDQKIEYFIFPYDSFTSAMVDHLAAIGYTGARAGTKGVTPADFSDPMREDFDVYNDENSIYYPEYPDVLKAYVDAAIAQGGWAIRELHGVNDSSWEPIPLADYRAHLDYVKEKVDEGALWVDTPSAVGHYRFARQYCSVPDVAGAELRFGSPSAECRANASALTFIIDTEIDAAELRATQNGQTLASQRLSAKRYLVDADPTLGNVILSGQ